MSLLSVDAVSKSFRGLRAVNAASFAVEDGKITALIGPNGAGKTTLFNLITNIYPVDGGRVLFHGKPIQHLPPRRIAELGLIRTFQIARTFPTLTALENVLLGSHRHVANSALADMLWWPAARRGEAERRRQGMRLLELFGLAGVADQPAIQLPMGSQKILEVVRALIARPALLLLDEPAAGLNDTETYELSLLLRSVKELGVPMLLVEHNMSLVMGIADEIVVLDAGSVIAKGTPAAVRSDARVIQAYLG